MRPNRGIVMPMLAIIAGIGMMAGAVSMLCISNVVENVNTVEEVPVEIGIQSTSTTPDGDLPDYAPGPMMVGVAYDMYVTYTTTRALEDAVIIVEITKYEIAAQDVTFAWADGGNGWSNISWADSGDVLTGELGYKGSIPSGEGANYYGALSYHTPGTYTFRMWVEGTVVT
jgi:hypothetical protein